MALAQSSLPFYSEPVFSAGFSHVPSLSNVHFFDNGPVSLAPAVNMAGQSLFNYEHSNFGTTWDFLYAPTFFNLPSVSFQSVSFADPLVPEEDFLLTENEAEFLQQLNGITPVMHPNLVSTLKNMVGPGAPSPGSSAYGSQTHFEQQQNQHQIEAFYQYCPMVETQMVPTGGESQVTEAAEAVSELSESLKQTSDKSEIDDNEAAVVSVDLIQNRRPFRCDHTGCNKTFKNPQTMKMHNKTHYTDGSAASREGLMTSITLSSSLKAGHNKKIPSRCPKCKKTFVGLYELRRHYGRKHSEGEKPFGCRKCGKKFYIEVDVRDHKKLCGEPIECKCGLKFAFKCNLVAHKKAHPACQDQSNTSVNSSNSNSHSSSSDDSDQSRGSSFPCTGGTKRLRQDSISPTASTSHTSVPFFRDIPEVPEFKTGRYDLSDMPYPTEGSGIWASNFHYAPSLSNFPLPSLLLNFGGDHPGQHFASKVEPFYEPFSSGDGPQHPMGTTCNESLQGMVRLY